MHSKVNQLKSIKQVTEQVKMHSPTATFGNFTPPLTLSNNLLEKDGMDALKLELKGLLKPFLPQAEPVKMDVSDGVKEDIRHVLLPINDPLPSPSSTPDAS
jgi:hypothetical protein